MRRPRREQDPWQRSAQTLSNGLSAGCASSRRPWKMILCAINIWHAQEPPALKWNQHGTPAAARSERRENQRLRERSATRARQKRNKYFALKGHGASDVPTKPRKHWPLQCKSWELLVFFCFFVRIGLVRLWIVRRLA